MLHIVLYQPEIPPNTGNIIRLCANTGAQLHLIHPLGFELQDKQLQRAGLDYHEWASIQQYHCYENFIAANQARRIIACSTKAQQHYSELQYQADDMLLFGPETRGLPMAIIQNTIAVKIPMQPASRSLNLSNAAAIILYEAWRQLGFEVTS